MAALFKTNLVIVSSPLPADFRGTPQEFYEALIERMEIQSPVGTNFFVVGDIQPSTNQGPWLKGGTKWYVFDVASGTYVPLDVSDSIQSFFTVSAEEPDAPEAGDATIWLKTVGTRVVGWYFWDGSTWRPGGNVPPSGTTAQRPTNPNDLEQYFDTDISCLIHFERGAWRTISGTPGDIKFVTTSTLQAALTANPGWAYIGESNQNAIGRVLGVASKDPGASPVSSFAPAAGISQRASSDLAGEESHVLTSGEIEDHTHLVGALTALHSDNNINLYRVDDADNFLAPAPRPPNYALVLGDGASDGTKTGELPATAAGTMLVTSRQLTLATAPSFTGAADAHNTMQPTQFFWCLVKQ